MTFLLLWPLLLALVGSLLLGHLPSLKRHADRLRTSLPWRALESSLAGQRAASALIALAGTALVTSHELEMCARMPDWVGWTASLFDAPPVAFASAEAPLSWPSHAPSALNFVRCVLPTHVTAVFLLLFAACRLWLWRRCWQPAMSRHTV